MALASLGGNLVGALAVFAYLTLLPVGLPPGVVGHGPSGLVIAVFVGYLIAAGIIGSHWGHRTAKVAMLPLFEGRPQTSAEQSLTLALPWRMALNSLALWGVAAVLFAGLSLQYDHSGIQSVRTALGVLLGALTTCAMVFLLLERAMRPVIAASLSARRVDDAPPLGMRGRLLRRRSGIGPRLFVLWALGSGAPLVGIVLTPLGVHHADGAGFILPITVLAGIGLTAGAMVTAASAKAIAEPLGELRHGLRRVQEGDLTTSLVVDDAGEIGMLQAGFNRMIQGLRERRRLEDLFGRQVGPDVARRALERGALLGGERRDVSVMFVDIIGSTGLAQSAAPESVVSTLNRFFEIVVRVVAAEGGWVNKFQGDGALCVFGAPADQPDHAVRALRAAATLRRELLVLNGTSAPAVDAAIGVSSGPVVAGNVGSEQRFEYTVVGDAVNEAARLTERAKSRLGRVLASEETVSRAGADAGRWMVAGDMPLRGRTQTTLAFEPAAAGD